jgi:hypothetical protein
MERNTMALQEAITSGSTFLQDFAYLVPVLIASAFNAFVCLYSKGWESGSWDKAHLVDIMPIPLNSKSTFVKIKVLMSLVE